MEGLFIEPSKKKSANLVQFSFKITLEGKKKKSWTSLGTYFTSGFSQDSQAATDWSILGAQLDFFYKLSSNLSLYFWSALATAPNSASAGAKEASKFAKLLFVFVCCLQP